MKFRFFLSVALVSVLAVSCFEHIEDDTQTMEVTSGLYILNQGNYGSNDASLSFYNTIDGIMSARCFSTVNGQRLGDCAQDAIVYGTKLYISVYNSGVIFAIDKYTCELKSVIHAYSPSTMEPLSPRYLTSYNGQVYATFYEGYVGAIDTTSFKVTQLQEVGANPEELTVVNKKLFVANSGGLNYPVYDNTVSVLDPTSLELLQTIEVAPNPMHFATTDLGELYLISMGNYADVPATLQRISTGSGAVETVSDVVNPAAMACLDNTLYILTSYYDENWNAHWDAITYDASAHLKGSNFITDATAVNNMYSISVDKDTKIIYIGTSDYVSAGSIYAFSPAGQRVSELDANGLNPCKVIPVRAIMVY